MDVKLKPNALPATQADLLKQKDMKGGPTINDYVDSIHVTLWADPEYQRLHDAVYDEDAVEGSLAIDNMKAAERVRQYAKDNEVAYLGQKKLATIVKSLNVVTRRYHMSRKERAMTVGGEIVPNE